MTKRFLLGLACALLGACGSTTMALSGPQFPAREPTCEFQVFTTAPASGFVEIGVVDVTPGSGREHVFEDISAFRQEIQPYVCRAGGDAAIAFANGYGWYIKAAILKTVADHTPAAGAVEAGNSGQGGCEYDTQCRGDRICVEHTCQAPPTAVSAPAPITTP